MKTNLTQLAVMTTLFCGVSPQVLCGPVQPDALPQVADPMLSGKPAISPGSTSADLDNYVRCLRQQGYQILDRQQQLNGAGTVASFHLRAARPAGTPTAGSPKSFVVVNGDYRRMTEKITGDNKKVTQKEVENSLGHRLEAPAEALASKPPLSIHASRSDLDKYVFYYRQQGYTVTERQQKFNGSGKLLSFRFHAVRKSKVLSVPSKGVDALVTPQSARDTVYSGPTIIFRPTVAPK